MSPSRPLVCVLAVLLPASAGCGVKHPARPRLAEVERLPRLETSLPERTTLVVRAEDTATVDSLEKAGLCAQVRATGKAIPGDGDIGPPRKANAAATRLST